VGDGGLVECCRDGEHEATGARGRGSGAIAWLAWLVSGFAIACACAGLLLLFLNGVAVGSMEFDYSAVGVVLGISFSAVGGVISARRPGNPIGWLFLIVGLSQGFDSFDTQYARYALVTNPGSLPAAAIMAWMASWTYVPGLGLAATLTLLLFPTGRLPSPRWRWVPWAVVVSIALMAVPPAVILWPLRGAALVGDADPGRIAGAWLLRIQDLGLFVTVVCMFASAISLVFRFRRAGGRERRQLKWLTYGGVLFVFVFALSLFVPRPVRESGLWPVASVVLLLTVYPSIPVAVGVAILKDRLYDIDLIINRTLVYGSLTVLLATTYFGGIVVLQRLFIALTGQKSTLAVVASTLLIAALFSPLRRFVQAFIDRRFYRRKYDARRTLEEFGARLRDETDLDALGDNMVDVVKETMQPAHVSLWLRPHAISQNKKADG
jgi:hypothetical protein